MQSGFAVGWRQVAICFILLSATGMIASTYSIVAVPLAQEFQPSRSVLMLAMTVLSGVCAMLAPFVGNLMDRISLRGMMIAGGLFLGAGYASLSFATSFNQVLLIFALVVAPANVLIGPVAATVLLSRWFSKRRGRAVGIAIAGISAGGFVFPMIIQGLLNTYEWREAMRLLAGILVLWTVPAAALVIGRPEQRGLHPDGEDHNPAPKYAKDMPSSITTSQVLRDPAFWLICLFAAVVTSGMKGMVTNLAPLAIDNGIKAKDAAYLVSVYAGFGFIAKLTFAMLSDRFGPRLLMYMSLAGFAFGMALLTRASGGYAAIALGVAMIGLFGGMMVPLESFMAPRVFGQQIVGKAMGLISGVILIALLSTPPLFGLIFDLTDSYNGIFIFFAGLALVTMFAVPYLRMHPREAEADLSAKSRP